MGAPQDVALFRSEFLNNHPILLEYVVENAVQARPSSARWVLRLVYRGLRPR